MRNIIVTNIHEMRTILFSLAVLTFVSCNQALEKQQETVLQPEKEEAIDPNYNPEAKLADLGIELTTPSAPVANYVNAVRAGNLIFLAGKGPLKMDGENITGKVGADLTIEEGYEAARVTGINQLSVLKAIFCPS